MTQVEQVQRPSEPQMHLAAASQSSECSLVDQVLSIPAAHVFTSEEILEVVDEALAGNPSAQHALGVWFESDGQADSARRWYRSSAEKHFVAAQHRLLTMELEQTRTI